jgi:hypothetical protein
MSTFYLINNIRVGSRRLSAGSLINDAQTDASKIRSAGGVLVTTTNAAVAAAALLAQKLRKRGAPESWLAEVMEAALGFAHETFPKGANITGTGGTVQWSDGLRREISALSGAGTVTLGVAAGADGRLPVVGARWEFTRTDTSVNTLAFVNGGPGAGTLATLVVSKIGSAVFEFNAAGNWELVSAGPT